MSVTQTVEIPANHRLTIDVPREVPEGSVILTFTPAPKRKLTAEWLNKQMEGSITQSLMGAIPHSDITLDEIRALRLKKYDRIT